MYVTYHCPSCGAGRNSWRERSPIGPPEMKCRECGYTITTKKAVWDEMEWWQRAIFFFWVIERWVMETIMIGFLALPVLFLIWYMDAGLILKQVLCTVVILSVMITCLTRAVVLSVKVIHESNKIV